MEPDQVDDEAAICAIEAAKVGDLHRLRIYLDDHDGDVNARDLDTQGTLLHVSAACGRQRGVITRLQDFNFFVSCLRNHPLGTRSLALSTAATPCRGFHTFSSSTERVDFLSLGAGRKIPGVW